MNNPAGLLNASRLIRSAIREVATGAPAAAVAVTMAHQAKSYEFLTDEPVRNALHILHMPDATLMIPSLQRLAVGCENARAQLMAPPPTPPNGGGQKTNVGDPLPKGRASSKKSH